MTAPLDKRFNPKKEDPDWYKDESKAPKTIAAKIDVELEQQILMIRKDLMSEKMAQLGAISVPYEGERRGKNQLRVFGQSTG